MHFKYSAVLVQVFCSFAYGLFLPELFLIALFGLFNMYVCDRLSLAYYYRQPPLYDAEMYKRTINLMQWAPIFMFSFGYWALGNR